jgi:hypothetical protein
MSMQESTFRTMTCDFAECKKTATFQITRQGIDQKVLDENPWLANGRMIQTSDGRGFFYCSDECEIKNVGDGQHNKLEPKRIIDQPANAAAVAAAAASAKAAEEATEAIRTGRGGKVTLNG